MQSATDPLGTAGDPFGTAGIRHHVLAGWAASPARFREDANAEEDLVRGGYRDRLLVELAQNAADAAARVGVPRRLRLELAGETLRAANTGAPLDAGGVQGLVTLRASAKRDDEGTVGRFGVGFAAGSSLTASTAANPTPNRPTVPSSSRFADARSVTSPWTPPASSGAPVLAARSVSPTSSSRSRPGTPARAAASAAFCASSTSSRSR